MNDLPILSITTFLPLMGVFALLLMRGGGHIMDNNVRSVALFTSIVTFVMSVILYFNFDPSVEGFQLQEFKPWIPQLSIGYHMGVDGMSVLFILLTTILTPLAILASWKAIDYRVREYMIAFLIMETLLIGVFCALDFIVFYLFFEGVLIPMYLIIGIWGGERRVYASYKFFLYTLLGSVLMLVAILTIYTLVGSTDIMTAAEYKYPEHLQTWLWLAFLASFAVKIPMWPLHTWLPDAHVEAPTAGSVMLAGVMLKMGGYGLLRFSLPLFPEASLEFANFIYIISGVAVVYTSLVALAQDDMKKLIAYSSVAHMGIVTLGIFTFSEQGIQGAIFQMISHGLVSAALFLCVGVVYDREHTRLISRYGGLVERMPIYAVLFLIFTLGSIGLPGTSGFVGELLVLLAAFGVEWYWAAVAGTGMILSAAYMLWLYRRVVFGKIVHKSLAKISDLSAREMMVFFPLLVLVIFLGVYPSPALKLSEGTVSKIIHVISIVKEQGK